MAKKTTSGSRLEVAKTYKLYIGGKFPRTESGRYYQARFGKDTVVNICQASRKDVRNSVVVARKAFGGWSNKTAFNRSQILYRIAEMLEGRKAQFIEELKTQGTAAAKKEVEQTIDCFVYYAGWCDKYQQVFSSVNPVASAHFNFSVYEPMGVVGILATDKTGLLGIVSALAPVIAGGNVAIVLATEKYPLSAITLGEVIHSSDVPGGVVNILTGKQEELSEHFASHMDINALVVDETVGDLKAIQIEAANNVKRIIVNREGSEKWSPHDILQTQEVKTTWHPIEKVGGSGAGY